MHSYDRSIALQPKQSEPYVRRARVRATNKDLKGALEDFAAALNVETQNGRDGASVLVARALVYHHAGDEKNAKADVDAALKDKSAIELIPSLDPRAMILARAGEYEQMIGDLEELVEIAPKNPELLSQVGQLYAASKKPEKALEKFSAALNVDPKNWRILVARGETYLSLKKETEAFQDFESALAAKPGEYDLLVVVGAHYAKLKKWDKAIDKISAALKLKPDSIDLLAELGGLYAGNKQLEKAVEMFDAALKLKPDSPEILAEYGNVYAVAKHWRQAIEKYDAGLAVARNEQQGPLLRGRGDSYLHLGKHAEAIKDYERAMKIEPDEPWLLNNLAWVLATSPDAKLRDAKRSVELGTKACESTRYDEPSILSTLAAGYAELGDFEKAQKWASKAVKLGDDETRPELKKELDSYKEKKPWREFVNEPETPPPADAKKPDEAKNASAAKPGDKPQQK